MEQKIQQVPKTQVAGEQKRTDVLVITSQEKISTRLIKFLSENSLSWSRLTPDKFDTLNSLLMYVGTAVIETSGFSQTDKSRIQEIIRTLEAANIGTILINNHLEFPVKSFALVSVLQTGTMEELRGRIFSNIGYHKKITAVDTLIEDSQQAQMEEQLQMAGQVQRDFLPAKLPNSEKIQWASVFLPVDWVSGDIYDARRLDEQHIGFYVADAVGHSMPAALLTMFIKQAIVMRETIGNDYRIFGPVDVIRRLNERVLEQGLSGSLFTTCCYALLNTRTLQMSFSRAGHPYPILIRPGSEPELLQCRGGLLGVFAGAEFGQEVVQLSKGDKVIFYSDGAEPFLGDTDDQGQWHFSDEFSGMSDLSIKRIMDLFDVMATNRSPDFHIRDDITMLGLEIL